MSVTIQVMLPEELARKLEQAAAKLNMPAEEFVKETVEKRLNEIATAPQPDFIDWLCGRANIPDTDLASRVDEIVYGCGPHQ